MSSSAVQPEESVARLRELLDALPEDLSGTVFTHASWTTKRADSYERLAFLGDSVLSLAITSHIFPLLERFGAGELTKIRAQTVSGRSCRAVAERLGFSFVGVMPGGLQFAKRADDVALYGVTSKAWISLVSVSS